MVEQTDSNWKEEYREVGNNFREGFKLQFEISKGFIFLNSFLFAAYAAVTKVGTRDAFSLSVLLISIVGVLASVAFVVAHYRIAMYLRGFVLRGREIEEKQNFQVLSRVYASELEGRKTLFNNLYIPMLGFMIIGLTWVLLALISMGVTKINIPL